MPPRAGRRGGGAGRTAGPAAPPRRRAQREPESAELPSEGAWLRSRPLSQGGAGFGENIWKVGRGNILNWTDGAWPSPS